jgi:hypothetical protein
LKALIFFLLMGYVFGIDDKAEVGHSLLNGGNVGLFGVDDELQDAAIAHLLVHTLQDQAMIEPVEAFGKIHVHDVFQPVAVQEALCFGNCLLAGTSRPVTVAGRMKTRVEDGLQLVKKGLLDYAVTSGGHPEQPDASVRLGYLHSPDRQRFVGAGFQFVMKLAQEPEMLVATSSYVPLGISASVVFSLTESPVP